MIEGTKDFVQSEKKDMGKSTSSVRATRIQVTDDESQVSQIGSVVEEPEVVRMEAEKSKISLVSDTGTQIHRCMNHILIKRISLYGSRILILILRLENSFFVDC